MPPESTQQAANSTEFIVATSESIPDNAETPEANAQNPTLQSDSIPLPDDNLPKSASQKNKQPKPKAAQPEPNREAFWRATIQKQLQSGLSIREFCRREKLSTSAYHRWKRKIAKRDGQPFNDQSKQKTASKQNNNSKPTFIPVTLDPVSMSQPQVKQPQIEQPQVEILYASGTTVRIAAGCDEKTVSIILKAIGNGTC